MQNLLYYWKCDDTDVDRRRCQKDLIEFVAGYSNGDLHDNKIVFDDNAGIFDSKEKAIEYLGQRCNTYEQRAVRYRDADNRTCWCVRIEFQAS